jgi:hypothetical protein
VSGSSSRPPGGQRAFALQRGDFGVQQFVVHGDFAHGVIYWAEDGTALYKTPSGAMWHGKWEIKGNTLCADWKERPNNPCTRYEKTGDAVTVLDAASGQTRAKIMKTAPGNAEKLAP